MSDCCCCNDEKKVYSKAEKDGILEKIIAIETKMFVEVNQGQKVECQNQLKAFHVMRYMSFAVLSGETLQSYWEDLKFAILEGRNLVKEKYARMDNLIPILNNNPVITKIVAVENVWMKEVHEQYPLIVKYDQQFTNYETCELETYSDQTLDMYYRDVVVAKQLNINLVAERYRILGQKMGYPSLEELQARAAAKQNS